MALEVSSLVDVSDRISKNTTFIQDFLTTRGLPSPSFTVKSPTDFPNPENERAIELAREAILADTKILFDLVLDPVERLKWTVWQKPLIQTENQMIDVSVLQVIYPFKLAQAVPLEGGATCEHIAATTGFTALRVSSVLRQAVMNKISYEDHPNHVVHTAISAILLKDPVMRDWVGHFTEEGYPTNANWSEAMQKYPNSQELNEAPFAVAFDYKEPGGFFRYLEEREEPQKRFFGAMKGVGMAPGVDYGHLANGYDWESLGKATVVDKGGSAGHVSIALARRFSNLNFVVQDFKETVEASEKTLPAEFKGMVSFQAHDFFNPQPVRAEVYMMRHICHCWPDKYLIQILQQTVLAMDPGSRMIVVETVVLPPGQYGFLEERWARNMDLFMFSMLNAQDRSAEEWSKILVAADPRLRVASIQEPTGSHDAIIEIVLGQLN